VHAAGQLAGPEPSLPGEITHPVVRSRSSCAQAIPAGEAIGRVERGPTARWWRAPRATRLGGRGNELRLLRQSSRGRSLAEARPCDDHFSGRCGVPLKDGLLHRGWLVPEPAGYDLSQHGVEGALDWGVDVTTALTSRRRFAQPCLDWTERRERLARALAAALTAALMKDPEPWFVRRDHRGLRSTELGLGRLAHFGWEPRE
jgi:hypothetical protein